MSRGARVSVVSTTRVRLELLLRDVAAETGCLMSLLSPLPVVAWERRGRRPQKGGQFGIR